MNVDVVDISNDGGGSRRSRDVHVRRFVVFPLRVLLTGRTRKEHSRAEYGRSVLKLLGVSYSALLTGRIGRRWNVVLTRMVGNL